MNKDVPCQVQLRPSQTNMYVPRAASDHYGHYVESDGAFILIVHERHYRIIFLEKCFYITEFLAVLRADRI